MGYFFFLEGEDSKRICDCSIFKLIGINLIRQSALLCMEFPPVGAKKQEYVERVKLSLGALKHSFIHCLAFFASPSFGHFSN